MWRQPCASWAASVLKVLEMELERLRVPLELSFECCAIDFVGRAVKVISRARKEITGEKVVLAGGGLLLAVLYLFKWTFVSRPFVLLFLTLNFLLLAAVMLAIRLTARWARLRGLNFRNLLIVGSVANIIVVESARAHVEVGFWDYARFGIPVTILTTLAGMIILVWLAP